MTNIKKQLIGKKISRFLKTNQFVLFFHYNSRTRNEWYSIKTRMSAVACVDSLLVKNKIALKVSDLYHNALYPKTSSTQIKKEKISFAEKVIDIHNVKNKDLPNLFFFGHANSYLNENESKRCLAKKYKADHKKSNIISNDRKEKLINGDIVKEKQIAALYQGPTILLGFNHIKVLDKLLNVYKQDKTLVMLGGIYNNEMLLKQTDIQRMGLLSQKNYNSISVITELQKPTLQTLFTFKKALSFSTLKDQPYRLLNILYYRNSQLALS